MLVTPGAAAEAVADFALALILAAVRRLLVLDRSVREGRWRPPGLSGDLGGATVGIVGLGRIGGAVARRLHGFGCRLLAFEPLPDSGLCESLGIECVDLEQLLARADIVTLHAPLLPETRHVIAAGELALMKPTAVLVNTSRGALVDEPALVDALAEGRLAGAALDVFESEPLPTDHPLLRLPNVLVSGHAATFTRGGVERTIAIAVENLLEVAAGRLPPGRVANPDAWAGAPRASPTTA